MWQPRQQPREPPARRPQRELHAARLGSDNAGASDERALRGAAMAEFRPGFKISAVFRRNFGEYFVFGGNQKMVYRCFPMFSVSNFKISKKIINNRPKNRKKL